MPRKSETELRAAAEVNARKEFLAYPAQGIIDDLVLSLGPAIEQAQSDEEVQVLFDDWFKARPHLFKTIIQIPHDDLEAAFGAKPSLKAQGDLTKRYNVASVEAAAKLWQTSLGNLRPGVDPEAASSKTKAAPKSGEEGEAFKNPWADLYRCQRPPRDDADRKQMIQEHQTRIIKSFGTAGAARMAKAAGKTLGGQPLRK